MQFFHLSTSLAIASIATTISASALPSLLQSRDFKCDPRYGGLNDDCLVALISIGSGNAETDHTSRTFYTSSTTYAGFLNPATFYGSVDITGAKTWKNGECTIALWMPNAQSSQQSSWSDIQDAATAIYTQCVDAQQRGGRNDVGNMQVMIYQESEDTDEDSDTDPSQGQCPLEAAEQQQDVTNCFGGGIAGGSGGRKG